MALVPGICTQCGATLSADNSKDCMICPYCGTPFIVEKAINHFQNTYNISNSVVNIYGGESRDFVIRAGVLERYNGSDSIVNIPDTITMIGKSAFQDCIGLREVVIPKGVVRIERYAFAGCLSLSKVTLPDTLEVIGMEAFRSCTSLVDIFLPDSIKELCTGAFRDCRNLVTIRMPNNTYSGTNTVHNTAFSFCHKLVTVDLPNESWRQALMGSMYFSEYVKLKDKRKHENLCIYCGGKFKGVFTKLCSVCGKPKDY